MNRRSFFKDVGAAFACANLMPVFSKADSTNAKSSAEQGTASLRVQDNQIYIETRTLSAIIHKGLLRSLRSKITGEEFIEGVDVDKMAALSLIYPKEEVVPVDESKFGEINTYQISDLRAEVVFNSWDGDGVIFVTVDPETGDLLVEPAAYSSRPGVRACRWNMAGLKSDLELVAPFFQGIKLKLNDSLIKDSHWQWPMFWEAGLAILQSRQGGFWVHTRDNCYRYKSLKVGMSDAANVLGFDSEAYGPIDENLSGGGLCWRINVFEGDWKMPAKQYRDWLWQAYHLNQEEARRPAWIFNVAFAISWCPTEIAILEALAQKLPPERVLLHIPDWRTDDYDENYPNYTVSEKARKFIQKGQQMGFRMMPHCNAVDMDPSNPAYAFLQDFQYRDLESKKILGWSWYEGKIMGVPESNASRLKHRDKKVMVKVHPGLSMWRSLLGRSILKAAQDLNLDCVFTDVTLTTWNLHNCFVEATTASEGMRRLIDYISRLGKGLVVGGEGLNEITMQGLSFAQAHLFRSWHDSIDGLERTGGCPLNEFLFGKLCRTFGYSGLKGQTENQILRMRIHEEHGAIPTVTIKSAGEITNPNPAVKRLLEIAKDS